MAKTIQYRRQRSASWAGSSLLLLAVVSLGPLLVEALPVDWVAPYTTSLAACGSKATVALLMCLIIALPAWAVRRQEPWSAGVTVCLMIVAGLLTTCHWRSVDTDHMDWQRSLYLETLNHSAVPPHQFRPLPYAFTRALEWFTGDWVFACVAYRWFFTHWFLWGSYRLARLFHGPGAALAAPTVVAVYYPLSIQYYSGQLTDPLSHALFVLALVYVVEDRWAVLGAALALGVLAKETAVLMVPAYWACYWRKGWSALAKTIALGLVGTVAFLAARLPFGWRPGEKINGTELMIGTNLGIDPVYRSLAPQYENYLQPILFVVPFLPFIGMFWRRIDIRLKVLFITVTPLLLFSNLCFGWMYESRNYMPLLPLLATMALPIVREAPPA